MKNIFNYIIPAALLSPMLALAQFGAGDDGINTFFEGGNELINGYLITSTSSFCLSALYYWCRAIFFCF